MDMKWAQRGKYKHLRSNMLHLRLPKKDLEREKIFRRATKKDQISLYFNSYSLTVILLFSLLPICFLSPAIYAPYLRALLLR